MRALWALTHRTTTKIAASAGWPGGRIVSGLRLSSAKLESFEDVSVRSFGSSFLRLVAVARPSVCVRWMRACRSRSDRERETGKESYSLTSSYPSPAPFASFSFVLSRGPACRVGRVVSDDDIDDYDDDGEKEASWKERRVLVESHTLACIPRTLVGRQRGDAGRLAGSRRPTERYAEDSNEREDATNFAPHSDRRQGNSRR